MHRTRAVTATVSPSFRRPLRAVSALIVAGAIAGSAVPAAAASKACYNRTEHAAEQLIRMHTEMMVVGLTCQQVVPDKAPFAKYQEFSVKHRSAISKAEAELIEFQRKNAKGNATRQFDMYRTEVANEVSRRASIIGTDNYCKTFVPRIESVMTLSPDEIRTLTADEKNAGLMHLSQKPLCDIKVVSGPDTGPAVASVEPPRKGKKAPAASTPAKAGKPAPAKPGKTAQTAEAVTAAR